MNEYKITLDSKNQNEIITIKTEMDIVELYYKILDSSYKFIILDKYIIKIDDILHIDLL